GAFVELEQNIGGLIHISDLSWVRRVRHPGEIDKKGQELEVVVLSFDRNERRIALGLKQLESDPWDNFEREYPIRARTEGSVVRVLEKGVVVMLPLGVEGFIPNSQLGRTLAGDNKRQIRDGDNMELEVIEFDKINHRIVLSHSVVERENEKNGIRSYSESGEEAKPTIGDIMREATIEDSPEKTVEIKEETGSEDLVKTTDEKDSESVIETVTKVITAPEPDSKPEAKEEDVKTEPENAEDTSSIEITESEKMEKPEETAIEVPEEKVIDIPTDKTKKADAKEIETTEAPDESQVVSKDTSDASAKEISANKDSAKTKKTEKEEAEKESEEETEKKKPAAKAKKTTAKTAAKKTTTAKTAKPKEKSEKKNSAEDEKTEEKTKE
ncbi:S1 RNA-binding domain-containing protein, partial [bacterium]|nr:S1 RNA-binding domain-containing protein [bacterium]